ncbi:PCI-domain-containing protein [Wallemia mellicola]|uniref:PCI-domain-containing protein n=1 Tax=Wallemia mellicola TaxID=1708541 RepID=A0A4T0R9W5_9BASI|nr:PCI-domain-containing protein [Wallemia mellicola]TIB95928.1 PCI-domain-containing protein [Wallemia mellicola]TIB98909.1 PCI-domain-containing protein [Wallemia mellicola]TIC16170.1 PCI-domain-containing protein [Wallemia mellicola]TIC19464.1 PCI-domain-containing protein [Wallemia mellicola]
MSTESTAELKQILSENATTDADLRKQEAALVKLGEIYRDQQNAAELTNVIKSSRSFMSSTAKAKTAKLIRTLIDHFDHIKDSRDAQMDCLIDNINWAKSDKRVFLRQSLEIRLAGIYYASKDYKAALSLLDGLLKELKRLDDKIILTEVHILESKIYYSTSNIVKSKAALTSARTAANAIYCPPLLQAQLDLQAGILHANDRDWKTAFSYFFETLEGFSSQDDPRAVSALKYMLLCKIMLNLISSHSPQSEDVDAIIQNKMAQRYAGTNLDAMKAIAQAHKNRSLIEFEKALRDYKQELSADQIIKSHLSSLYDTLLESNLLKIIEPYSKVEIDHIANLLSQPINAIEQKLSQMILDKVFYGIIDQGNNCLIVFDPPQEDHLYDTTLDTLKNVTQVVSGLFEKTAALQSV